MKAQLLYQRIASLVAQNHNCVASNNDEWEQRSRAELEQIAKECLPRGSGIDCGTVINLDASDANRIVLVTSFHHMNDAGSYDGWTEHTVIVTPDLAFGFNLKITGRNRNDIKEYLRDVYHEALQQPVAELQVS